MRFRPDVAIDAGRFHEVLLAEHGTYVGPGHWFEVDDRHFRLGFGWPTVSELPRVSPRCLRRRTRSGLPFDEVEWTEVDVVGAQVVLEVVPEQ